jgi:hypothetical protein
MISCCTQGSRRLLAEKRRRHNTESDRTLLGSKGAGRAGRDDGQAAGGLAIPPSWRQCPQSSPTNHGIVATVCDIPLRRPWIRLSSHKSFASYSRTGPRNALPAALDQLSQLPASHTTKDAEKLPGWVRGRRGGRADGRREIMHFRRSERRSSKDTQWSRRTCCVVEENAHGESRCCCVTS